MCVRAYPSGRKDRYRPVPSTEGASMAKVAFLLADVFEDSEFQQPYDAVVVGKESGKQVTGKNGSKVTVDKSSGEVRADEFDAVVVPGGYSPDKVRTDEASVAIARGVHEAGKPVAAICHAGWVLAEAD